MSKKIFKVAFVGCGAISPNHLFALQLLDNVEIVALCDKVYANAEKSKEKYGLNSKIYTDYEEMLASEELDAVHIATPHFLHAPMTIAALKKNINVFLEKPMCINRKEIEEMIAAEKESKATACVCFQNRFISATKKAMEVVEADGGAISAYGSVFWERNVPYYTNSDWRGKYKTEGGGVMINQAIHTIDLVCQFLGKPKKLWATKANHHLKGIIEVEDTCEGMIEFEGGKNGNFYTTTSFHGKDSTTVYIVTKNHKIELSPPNLRIDGTDISFENEFTFVGKECYGNGHNIIIRNFYEALEKGTEVPVSLESAQYAVRVLLAAYESNDQETEI